MILRVRPLQFDFRAVDSISFPAGQAANIFRGAFGQIFRRIAGDAEYARMFAPRAESIGPSGLRDQPRPFVLRAASLDGRTFAPGERFTLAVNVFDPKSAALDHFRQAFAQLGKEGLGPGRPRIELLDARELAGIENELTARAESVGKIKVSFLTPTELKSGGEVLREAPFDALFKRARDRIAGLVTLYQSGDEVDFRGIGERAEAVRMTSGKFTQIDLERKSSRTGQTHGIGGFIGEAEYEGELAEFLPWLEAARWTGVGRLTVWGNGMIEVRRKPSGN